MPTAISINVEYQYESAFRVFVVNKSCMLTLLKMFISHRRPLPSELQMLLRPLSAHPAAEDPLVVCYQHIRSQSRSSKRRHLIVPTVKLRRQAIQRIHLQCLLEVFSLDRIFLLEEATIR